MGRGRSKGSGSAGAAKTAAAKATQPKAQTAKSNQPWWKTGANTPAGISYDEYMKMNVSQKQRIVHDILNDKSIKVPPYLDGSDTTKVIYSLGMNRKPKVVSDIALTAMKGKAMYRTMNDADDGSISGYDIAKQVRTGDYTQMSGKGGSVHGRALYFASSVRASAMYANNKGSTMIRAKVNPGAKVVSESKLNAEISQKNISFSRNPDDNMALYALSQGYAGWKHSPTGYVMIVDRGEITVSAKQKSVTWNTNTWG